MQNFNEFGFNKDLELAIKAIGFTEPTPIQAQTIPLALAGHDIWVLPRPEPVRQRLSPCPLSKS